MVSPVLMSCMRTAILKIYAFKPAISFCAMGRADRFPALTKKLNGIKIAR